MGTTRNKEVVEKLISEALTSENDEMVALTKRIDVLESRDNDLNALQDHIRVLENKIDWLVSAKHISDLYRDLLLRKIDQNEQYTRKQNLIVSGMKIKKDHGDEDIRNMIIAEFKRLDLNVQVDRAHRTGNPYFDSKGVKQTPIIVRFAIWRSRDIVYQARKRSYFYYKADLTNDRRSLLGEALERVREEGSLANQLIAFVSADRNCNLVSKSKDGRFKIFNSIEEFDGLTRFLDNSQAPHDAIHKLIVADKKQKYTGTKLVNLSKIDDINKWIDEPNHKYIGRAHDNVNASPWANYFKVSEHGRDEAIRRYRERLIKTPSLMDNLGELLGFELGCWCDTDCHGQVLIDMLYDKYCTDIIE